MRAGQGTEGPIEHVQARLADQATEATEVQGDEACLQLSADERSQIAARLRLSPSERLRYLEDMIEFEEQARHARRMP